MRGVARLAAASGLVALACCAALAAGAPGPPATPAAAETAPAARITAIARRVMAQRDLRAVIIRVERRGRPVVTAALGESQAGVPATTRMRFRIGAIAIPYVATVLLQLRDEGRLSLDDPVARWFPGLPNADRVTLRTLANFTSGYPDYVAQKTFVTAFHANPFRSFTQEQLLGYGLAPGPLYAPGTSFNYSHTNYVILGRILQRVTGRSLGRLIRERVVRPLGLRTTGDPGTPAIRQPVLHAYSAERGRYEESTFWNPSWTLATGAIMTSDIRDVARSARAIGRGALLSERSRQEQVAPETAGLGGLTRELYFGLGILVQGSWLIENPQFGGFGAVMAYLPSKDLSVAVVSTKGRRADVAPNEGEEIFRRVAAYLSPSDIPPRLP